MLLESLDDGTHLRVVLSARNVAALLVKLDDPTSQQTIFKDADAGAYRTLWARGVEDGHARHGSGCSDGEAAPWVEMDTEEAGRAIALLRPPSLLLILSRACLEWLDANPAEPLEISPAAPRVTVTVQATAAHYPQGTFPGVMAESTEHELLRRGDR
jgi:hypothetical protein